MKLARMRIQNAWCFLDTDYLSFAPGMTIVVGQNNVGKTALLSAIKFDYTTPAHRSVANTPSRSAQPPQPQVTIEITGVGSEIDLLLARTENTEVTISTDLANNAVEMLAQLRTFKELRIEWPHNEQKRYLGVGRRRRNAEHLARNPDGTYRSQAGGGGSDLEHLLLNEFGDNGLFRLRSERMNIASGAYAGDEALLPDAANLPGLLHALQSKNTARFLRLCDMVRRVLPTAKHLQVRNDDAQRVEIVIWPCQATSERDDLAIPLVQCGTGVSQVLVMAYLLVSSEHPRTFIIDEPNSFLHPGAVFKLIELFREHPQHQYVIATHSPEVVMAAEPETILHIERKDGDAASIVSQLSLSDIASQRRILADVGVRLSSFFGADRVLWVEGQTEEYCFPKVLARHHPDLLSGLRILRVSDTGSFARKKIKDIRAAANMYERLSKGSALIPPAVGFLFDREEKTDEEMRGLRQLVPEIHFLKRRMIENYLLDSAAIRAALREEGAELSGLENDPALQLSTVEIETVKATRVLGDLFGRAVPAVEFKKPHSSNAILDWLLENSPDQLKPLADEVADVIRAGK